MILKFGWMYRVTLIAQVLLLVVPFAHGFQNRIVGGQRAPAGKFPSMVSLRLKDNHICGGTLITKNNVLAAAHCFEGERQFSRAEAAQYGIMVGDIRRDLVEKSAATRESIEVMDVVVHERYKNTADFFDIAIILLAKSVEFNENVQIATLTTEPPITGTNCTVTGFGITTNNTDDFKPSDRLLEAIVFVYSMDQCTNKSSLGKVDPESMLCVGNLDQGKDSCQGDSGGPLYCNNVVVGIVSFGAGCADSEIPGVYTSIYHYLSWIDDALNQLTHRKSDFKLSETQKRNVGLIFEATRNWFYFLACMHVLHF